MKNIIFALVVMLFVGCTIAAEPPVSEIVPFDGVVEPMCLFSNVINGVVEVDPLDWTTLESTIAGTIDLQCTDNATVSILEPVESTGLLTFDSSSSTCSFVGSVIPAGDETSASTTSGGVFSDTLTISTTAVTSSIIPAGIYQVDCEITATPL